jgi:hypothetical protein
MTEYITVKLTKDQAQALVKIIDNHCVRYEGFSNTLCQDSENAFWFRLQRKLEKLYLTKS